MLVYVMPTGKSRNPEILIVTHKNLSKMNSFQHDWARSWQKSYERKAIVEIEEIIEDLNKEGFEIKRKEKAVSVFL